MSLGELTPQEMSYMYGKRPMRIEGRRIDCTSFLRSRRKCPSCGMNVAGFIGFIYPDGKRFSYTKPDQYQVQAGVDPSLTIRAWKKCCRCGLLGQQGSLSDEDSRKLYTNGYRSVKMRSATVHDEFHRILASGQSENFYRVSWILDRVKPESLLDIGSGLGLFPYEMTRRSHGIHVDCFEPNSDSHEFISEHLGLSCCNDFYRPNVFKRMYDLVSLVHVLEHVNNPVELLSNIKLDSNEWVYIEVPDSTEFDYLDPDHDDFNSTHHWFFSPEHIIMLLKRCDFVVDSLHTHITERGLSRIMVLAKKRDRCLKTES